MEEYAYSIHISEVLNDPQRWVMTRNWFGKTECRELEKFGNRHAVFEKGSEWGVVHVDQYNATSMPSGTINHLAKWGNEQTGIPEGPLRLGGWALLLYAFKKFFE